MLTLVTFLGGFFGQLSIVVVRFRAILMFTQRLFACFNLPDPQVALLAQGTRGDILPVNSTSSTGLLLFRSTCFFMATSMGLMIFFQVLLVFNFQFLSKLCRELCLYIFFQHIYIPKAQPWKRNLILWIRTQNPFAISCFRICMKLPTAVNIV